MSQKPQQACTTEWPRVDVIKLFYKGYTCNFVTDFVFKLIGPTYYYALLISQYGVKFNGVNASSNNKPAQQAMNRVEVKKKKRNEKTENFWQEKV